MESSTPTVVTTTSCGTTGCGSDVSMFLLRLGLAFIFLQTGWAKITHMEMTMKFFTSLGAPAIFAYLVGYGEFLGGLGMLFGVLTRWAGYGLALIILGAIYLTDLKSGFVFSAIKPYHVLIILTSLAVALGGAGCWSLGRFLPFGKR